MLETTHPIPSKEALRKQVNHALKNFFDSLALSRSPLANSDLVRPTLIRDDVSPTADERGHALRLVLRWAVEQLAPGACSYPFGVERPFDDPTWIAPEWWRYNLLRHRYIEPLHPDLFVDGGRFTETLIALTGIPSQDAFYGERNRAIDEVAEWLQRQLRTGEATTTLQHLAFEEVYRPLQERPDESKVLSLASNLEDVFPRALLQALAQEERIADPSQAIEWLTRRRLLLTARAGESLWLSPDLRAFAYKGQSQEQLVRRHRNIADYFQAADEPLKAAIHFHRAGDPTHAVSLLLANADELVAELDGAALLETLGAVQLEQVEGELRLRAFIVIADTAYALGRLDEAIDSARQALAIVSNDGERARVYRRLGKYYEKVNQVRALDYYDRAADHFAANEQEFVQLLKDRGWLHILRSEWSAAEEDLRRALSLCPGPASDLTADIHDAIAVLYNHQNQPDQALPHSRTALRLREELGDALRIGKSLGNLGSTFRAAERFEEAIQAFREALTYFYKSNNHSMVAIALLNIGTVQHLTGHLQEALHEYQESLTLCQQTGLTFEEIRLHSNLAEALSELGLHDQARNHWQTGLQLSRERGFSEETDYFLSMAESDPALKRLADEPASKVVIPALTPRSQSGLRGHSLTPEEEQILSLAGKLARLTPRILMAHSPVSKATATRRLAALAERALLTRWGKGRGTYYTLTAATEAGARSIERLQPQFVALQPMLWAEFNVTAIGMQHEAEAPESPTALPLRLLVEFERVPQLTTFFALESELTKRLRLEVDLRPIETFSLTDQVAIRAEALWFWRTQPEIDPVTTDLQP